jgi:transmembrane sensor
MNINDRFSYLLQLYLAEKISVKDHDEFLELIATNEYDDILAKSIQKDLAKGLDSNTVDLPPHIAQEIIRNIYHAEKNTAKILPIKKRNIKAWYWMAAAASVILIAISVYFFEGSSKIFNQKSFTAIIPGNTISEYNSSQKEEVLTLSDGSRITLQPKSTLHYPRQFSDGSREVYLEGEAFFQITKNPQKPFLVYYNNIITKVLGTSFIINTNPQTGNVEVIVKTGRVQVSENEKLVKGDELNNAVIVTPNQKAIYKTESRLFETTLVANPEPIADDDHKYTGSQPPHKENFIYDQEKLLNVFKQLEDTYGIEIITENANLNNCVFTGDVSDKDLFTKLKIICLTTNSSFEVNGTKILIKGKGCQ